MGIDKFFEKFGLSKPEPDEDEAGVEAPPAELAKKPAEPAEPAAKAARPVQPEAGSRGGNVVTLGGAGSSIHEGGSKPLHIAHGSSAPNMKVVVIQPRSLDDSQQIANCLKEKRPVVINFEGVDDQLYRRILDFVSGTTYALDGNVNSISTRVWLFSPKNVNVSVSKQTNQGFTDMPWEKK